MAGVLSRLQRDRHNGQSATKLPPHRLGQRQKEHARSLGCRSGQPGRKAQTRSASDKPFLMTETMSAPARRVSTSRTSAHSQTPSATRRVTALTHADTTRLSLIGKFGEAIDVDSEARQELGRSSKSRHEPFCP